VAVTERWPGRLIVALLAAGADPGVEIRHGDRRLPAYVDDRLTIAGDLPADYVAALRMIRAAGS
jgi:hypothetical protein